MIKLTHLAGGFRSLGGVEAILHHHMKRDAASGIDSRFVITTEPPDPPVPRVSFLNMTADSTIRSIRRAASAAMGSAESDVAVYHNVWAMHYYCDLDKAKRRVFLLHGYGPFFEEQVRRTHEFADGLLCVSRPLEELVRKLVPHIEAERVGYIPLPIFPPTREATQKPLANRPLLIGFCGRLIIEQKRVDRVPAFLDALAKAGIDYRLEFLGDGPELPFLTELARKNSNIVLHGRKTGRDYWNIMKSWDTLISFSDYEGTPLSMLEAMTQGVIPIMPKMGSGADDYAMRLDQSLVYEQDDFETVAKTLIRLAQLPTADLHEMRLRAVHLMDSHSIEHYMEYFAQFAQKMLRLPRRSRNRPAFRPFPLNVLNLNLLTRAAQARRIFTRKAPLGPKLG